MGKGGFVYRFEVTVGTGGGSFSLLALSSPSSVIHNQLGYILTPLPPIKSRPPEFRNLRVCARARVVLNSRASCRPAEAAPVLAAAVALATAEAIPRQLMVGESGLAYRLPSRGEEPDWPGQPEGARASAREPLGTLWW